MEYAIINQDNMIIWRGPIELLAPRLFMFCEKHRDEWFRVKFVIAGENE